MTSATARDTAPAIAAENLVKRYGGRNAVDGISLHLPRGAIHALLGPNGAGKTTTVRMLATLVPPDGGAARIFGHDVVREANAVRRRIALTGQFASVDEDLTGRENLLIIGGLLGLSRRAARERADALLSAFDLAEAAGRAAKSYSGGMRRRLDIAASLIVTPDLIFLDEPTTGLDPRSRAQVWDIVRDLAARGTAVLLTTQYLEEADRLAQHIGVIDHGRMIAQGTSAALKASVGAGVLHLVLTDADARVRAENLLRTVFDREPRRLEDARALALTLDDPAIAASIAARLGAEGIGLSSFHYGQPSLDEVFFALTGAPLEADPDEAGREAENAA